MDRAEIRRLADWYLVKTESEVTRHLVRERVLKPLMPEALGGGSPDSSAHPRGARQYPPAPEIHQLAGRHAQLAGRRRASPMPTSPAAATLSVLDYLGEIDWSDHNAARDWYTRMKSRPVLPAAARRPGARPVAGVSLCGSRFLSARRGGETLRQLIDREAARAGFDAVAVTAPDAIPLAPARLAAVRRRGPSRLDGLDGRDAGAPRPIRTTLWPRGALDHHARHELRAGQRPARHPRPAATAARSRSMRRTATITT